MRPCCISYSYAIAYVTPASYLYIAFPFDEYPPSSDLQILVFFSSRRRHTRCLSDWSSDVCSSDRSEEHTSELQSLRHLVCRLLLGVQPCTLSIDRKSTRLNSSHLGISYSVVVSTIELCHTLSSVM